MLSLDPQVMALILVPAAIVGFFLTLFVIFKIDMKVRGQTVTNERIETHRASMFVTREYLTFFVWLTHPIKSWFVRHKISPNVITILSMVIAGFGAVAAAFGHMVAAGMLFVLGGMCDIFDGWVARETQQVTRGGGFLDSTLDRISEVFMFGGYIYYYSGRPEVFIALAGLGASQVFSYARAKAESLGVTGDNAKGGIMGRGERVFTLASASVLAPLLVPVFEGADVARPVYHVIAFALWVIAFFSVTSLYSRIKLIYDTLNQQDAGKTG